MPEIEETRVPSKDECVIAMLAHVLMIVSYLWAPLIIYFAKRDSRFVAFHALQALYWQLIALCATVLSMIALFAVVIPEAVSAGANGQAAMPGAVFVIVPLFFVGWAINIVLGILFGIKSWHGEWAAYPLIGRWARRSAKARTGSE